MTASLKLEGAEIVLLVRVVGVAEIVKDRDGLNEPLIAVGA